MNRRIILALVAVVAAVAVGAIFFLRSPNTSAPGDVPFATVKKDFHGGVEVSKNIVVSDTEAWIQLWNQMSANITPQPPASEIDFGNDMIIGVFMGTKSTGGYSTEIIRIAQAGERITVYVREVSPGPNCAVTLALTSPYHIVKIRKSADQIDFSVTKDVTECPVP